MTTLASSAAYVGGGLGVAVLTAIMCLGLVPWEEFDR